VWPCAIGSREETARGACLIHGKCRGWFLCRLILNGARFFVGRRPPFLGACRKPGRASPKLGIERTRYGRDVGCRARAMRVVLAAPVRHHALSRREPNCRRGNPMPGAAFSVWRRSIGWPCVAAWSQPAKARRCSSGSPPRCRIDATTGCPHPSVNLRATSQIRSRERI